VKAILSSAVAVPTSILALAAAITASAAYAIAATVLGISLLLFLLVLFRGIALRIEWGKRKKKIWFERIPPSNMSQSS
jgi:hypothetical protein